MKSHLLPEASLPDIILNTHSPKKKVKLDVFPQSYHDGGMYMYSFYTYLHVMTLNIYPALPF